MDRNPRPACSGIRGRHGPEYAPRYAVLEPVRAFDNVSLEDWYTRRLAPAAEVYSDGLACFAQAVDTGHAHSVLVTGGGRAATQARGARWVNVILANAKRAISGRYHAFKHSKYARLYLGAWAAERFSVQRAASV